MKTHTHTTTTYTHTLKDGTEIELELPIKPDSIMDYHDVLAEETADGLAIGYLVHDSDCANPLEDCDGMGHLYECRRHGSTLADYERALGLADGGPDLELVMASDAYERKIAAFIDDDPDDAERIRAEVEAGDHDDDIMDEYGETLWQEGREAGTIGDKHAVLLDVYEHGGIAYSTSGSGMQSQFDTARAGAVWVPDDCAREEILRRAPAYMTGEIREKKHGSKTIYEVRTYQRFRNLEGKPPVFEFDGIVHQAFESWGDAFAYLDGLPGGIHQRPLIDGERTAAVELAAEAAKTYTDWRNGNCYGIVIAHYNLTGGECIEEDTCWGFVGDDYAYDSLKNDYFPKEPA